jgi:hypothetical protein
LSGIFRQAGGVGAAHPAADADVFQPDIESEMAQLAGYVIDRSFRLR